jgi:hypothetical protein
LHSSSLHKIQNDISRITVIQTDQTDCFHSNGNKIPCADTGQDGELRIGIQWPELRFIDHGETVTDRLTHLTWTKDANLPEFPLMWQEAQDYVREMNVSGEFGYNDWRLPVRKELFHVLSHANINPALPSRNPFLNVFTGYYWTSTTCARLPDQAWYVHLGGGKVYRGMKHASYMVWPVRGVIESLAQTETRFLDGNFTLLDRHTNLMWTKRANCSSGVVDWQSALDAIKKMNSEQAFGYNDWRLPNIRELESLVDVKSHTPALPPEYPFEQIQEGYWSSTTSIYNPSYSWVLYFVDGAVGVGYKSHTEFYVWAVRTGG